MRGEHSLWLPLIAAAVLCLIGTGASATTITSFPSHNCGGQNSAGTYTGCQLRVLYPVLGQRKALFDVFVSSEDTAGLIFSADSSNANFEAFVDLLTNGQDNVLETNTSNYLDGVLDGGNGSLQMESTWFRFSPTLNGIDLLGYDITSIDLRIDSVEVVPPDLEQGFPYPGISVRASLSFNGELIPEPGTGLLVIAGLLGLAARRRLNV